MKNINKNKDYLSIVDNILNNEEFNSIGCIEHHGTNRLDHSIKVSYYSYKITKILKLDYEQTARAGLLHDFFLSEEDRTFKDRFVSTFVHPKKSVENSSRVFGITDKEENIIRAHMFPLYTALPKYAESWVVSLVDKAVGLHEFSVKFSYKLSYATNLFIILLLRNIK